jgi:putative sugar O-methyltransferase
MLPLVSGRSDLLFDRMRENYALASQVGLPYMAGSYWSRLLSSGRQGYEGKGDFLGNDELWINFRNNVISKGLDNANVPEEAIPRVLAKWRTMYDRLQEELPERLRPYLEEPPIGNPVTLDIDGIRVSQSSLEYAYMLAHLEPYLAHANVVVDIGGGYGGLVSLVKRARPDTKLILFDLPEVNAIQTYFLEKTFPALRFAYLQDVHELEVIDPATLDFDFLVLPGQLMARLVPESFDVVINTRSMMEMDERTVAFYLRQIQGKLRSGGFFYCVNRYQKKTLLKEYPFDDRWYVSYSRPWPSFIDENPHHELLAGRTSHPVQSGLREHVATLPPHEAARKRIWQTISASLHR